MSATLRPRVARPARASVPVSLTPLVDVLLILVIFFLVTSSYLDLDMIPMAATEEGGLAEVRAEASAPAEAAPVDAALVRIAADGRLLLSGTALAPDALAEAIAERRAARPDLPVLILPSPFAPTQSLVDALTAAATAGAPDARVIRAERAE